MSKKYQVEVHIGMDVFTKQFKEESTARRCYDRLEDKFTEQAQDEGIVDEIRLWHMKPTFDQLIQKRGRS